MNFTDELIEQRYNKDKLVLLPINPNSSFVYWEITDKTLEKFGIDPKDVQLSFKLFDATNHEIIEFSSSFAISNYYINHESDHKSLYVKLFLNVGAKSQYISSSNIIGTQQNTPESTRDDLIYTSTLLGGK
ncbi:MAG: DUF4912 domain-containing protein [Sulfurimonas sp.]|nr:DUF4912 domain-containing protein [Sulfurimonas sp.]